MTRQINKEGRIQDFHPDVGAIWRSRNKELEQQVFDQLPDWMEPEDKDIDFHIDLKRLIPKALKTLTKKEQMVLVCRHMYEHTLEEVGMWCFDVTRERIRQIESHAMRRLRHPSRSDNLHTLMDDYLFRTRKKEEERQANHKAHMEFLDRWSEEKLLKKLLELRDT